MITEKAIASLLLSTIDEPAVKRAMAQTNAERHEQLAASDREFYQVKGMAEALYAFIKANKQHIAFP